MSDERKSLHRLLKQLVDTKEERFVPGKTPILTGMAIYDSREISAIMDSLLDGWFGLGKKGEEFEGRFSKLLGGGNSVLVNSGSSANLIALDAIKTCCHLRGGEIITPACTFPTTFNPIVQLGFKPSLVDVDSTLNMPPEAVGKTVNKNTRGVIFAHTMGNPARVDEIRKIASENSLFVIEDCCDALGSAYGGMPCGTFGDAATFSFYPAHGITLGEGGLVFSRDAGLWKTARSLRDWGRDCWCRTDEKSADGACGKRFDFKINGIPYDHKYLYSHIGYNMKPLELQAAMGLVQLEKLDGFNQIRKRNLRIYSEELAGLDEFVELPEINPKADPVFFGLPLIINNPRIDRKELIKFLNSNKIATRLLFAGNIIRQPAYADIDAKRRELPFADRLMRDCFWLGLHPGVTEEMIKYVASKLREYIRNAT